MEQDSAVEEVAVGAAASVAASELDNDPITTTILELILIGTAPSV